jgi:heparosan-N-sulfate-glucuronate 5-epimerase
MTTVRDAAPQTAGFFSSDSRMSLPVGSRVDPAGVAGYPIDLRVKAASPGWPGDEVPTFTRHYVEVAQYGLGCFERWLAGEGDRWLEAALTTGRFLIAEQDPSGSWLHKQRFPHTFPLPARWCCGMAQGEAASLLVRLYLETGEEVFARTAQSAIRPLSRPLAEGGVMARIARGRCWPEEYPTSPPSFVLNGAIFAWWGVRDVAVGLRDREAAAAFEAGVDTLVESLPRFDLGWWTLYCLYPFPVPNVASTFYQALHATQLEAMNILAPRPELKETSERWRGYLQSEGARRRALLKKMMFRLLIPRNRLLAHRLPWNRGHPALAGTRG